VFGAIEAAGGAVLARSTAAQRESISRQAHEFTDALCWRLFGVLGRAMAIGSCTSSVFMEPEMVSPPKGVTLDEVDLTDAEAIVKQAGEDWRTQTGHLCPADTLGSIHEARLALEPVVDVDNRSLSLQPVRSSRRRSLGVFYTPAAIVEHLLDAALDPVIESACTQSDPESALLSLRVCDPSCGSGRFLVAAGRRIARRLAQVRQDGRSPSPQQLAAAKHDVLGACLFGVDLDPFAIELCRWAISLEASPNRQADLLRILRLRVRVGNALAGAPHEDESLRSAQDAETWCSTFVHHDLLKDLFHWGVEFASIFEQGSGFDVVVGNPPFLNQLRSSTARDRSMASLIGARLGGQIGSYTDSSAAFLLLASALTRPGGRVCMIQPQSLFAARDAKPVRDAVLGRGSLTALWASDRQPFAGITTPVCAPTIHIGGPNTTTLRRTTGDAFEPIEPITLDRDQLATEPTWSRLLAPSDALAPVCSGLNRTLRDEADATADFRDQYYGLIGYILEDAALTDEQRAQELAFPLLITAGLIDLAECRWASTPTRIHKQRWLAPRIDRQRLNDETSLGPWLTSRLVPKILMATQTRIIEVIVDEHAALVPSVPVITITPRDPSRLWHIAAALASPLVSARAHQNYAGAALASGAIKLSAKQVLDLPCPEPCELWDRAARLFEIASREPSERRTALTRCAELMLEASRVPDDQRAELIEWWQSRWLGTH